MADEFDTGREIVTALKAQLSSSTDSTFRTRVRAYLDPAQTWTTEHIRRVDVPKGNWAGRAPLVSIIVGDARLTGNVGGGCEEYTIPVDVLFIFATNRTTAIASNEVMLNACQDMAEALRRTIYDTAGYGDIITVIRYGHDEFTRPNPHGVVYCQLNIEVKRER